MLLIVTYWYLLTKVVVWGYDSVCPLDSLQHFENSVFSQNGEDGVLLAILEAVGYTDRTYVEFGVQNGKECNSRLLRERFNFSGLMMDGDHSDSNINLHKEFITVSNILDLFEKYNVSKNVDILSVDVDMFDWWILARILGVGGYRPRVIVVEVNPTIGISTPSLRYHFHEANSYPLVVHHPFSTSQTMWDLTRYSGGNPRAFQLLGESFGYDMVYCESCGVNCFLVQRDILPSSCRSSDGTSRFSALPKVPYPCFGALTHNYVGHLVDSQLRLPLLASADLIAMATNDSLLRLSGEGVREVVARASCSLFPRVAPATPPRNMCSTGQPGLSEEERAAVQIFRSSPEVQTQVSLTSFCQSLGSELRHDTLTCTRLAEHIYDETLEVFQRLEAPVAAADEAALLRRSEALVLEGLKFDPNHARLNTLQRYFAQAKSLQQNDAPARFAHAIQSFVSPDGGRGHTVIGLGLCDDPYAASVAMKKRWSLNDEGREQVFRLLVGIRNRQLFGDSFGDLSDDVLPNSGNGHSEWNVIQSSHKYDPLDFLPQCLQAVVPTLLRQRVRSLCGVRRSSRTVVVISPPYGGAEGLGQALSQIIPSRQMNARADFGASADDINSKIIKLLIDCNRYPTRRFGSDATESSRDFYRCLAGKVNAAGGATASGLRASGLSVLERLSEGDLTSEVHPLYLTAVDDIIQSMYTLATMLSEEARGHDEAGDPGVKVLADPLFSYTSALWAGPLGGLLGNTMQFQVVLSLVHPSTSVRCMISEEQLPYDQALGVYMSYFRSIISTLRQVGQERVYIFSHDEITRQMTTRVDLIGTTAFAHEESSVAYLLSRLGFVPQSRTPGTGDKVQLPACMLLPPPTNDEVIIPEWVKECYHSLLAAARNVAPVVADICLLHS